MRATRLISRDNSSEVTGEWPHPCRRLPTDM